jgi:penicillin-binding protein 1A
MSDHQRTTEPPVDETPDEGVVVPFPGWTTEDDLPPAKPKIRWLRLIALLTGLGLLAAVSTVFGMMMAVASDLPELDVLDVAEHPSKMYDRTGKIMLGTLTGNQRRILVQSTEISPVMKQAIVAIEDRRFFTNSGVDLRGISRALFQDVVQKKVVQGGSTITQQLVKNRLEAQNDRTLFQKLRESAIAFHMTRKWDKQRILKNYLNTIYFGNGAYGIESAAKTYFGSQHLQCGEEGERTCAAQLEPQEAALIAGVVASPSGYDPITNPEPAKARRDLVLQRMFEQGYLTRPQFDSARAEPLPTKADINPPSENSVYPYFTTWVRQQVVDKVGTGPAFEGGLTVRTTIDAKLQDAAQAATAQLPSGPNSPAVAMVVIDNKSSEVRALVGGPSGAPGTADDAAKFNEQPFNLATQGQRQPGSSFKPFTLAAALNRGVSPNQTFTSKKKFFCVTRSKKGKCKEFFEVNNYEDKYAGVSTLANATAYSDNSVYAEVGITTGTTKIAKLARQMGIRTKVSTNYAMILGGLKQGVTVMDMAHAYETFAMNGERVWGTMSTDTGDAVAGPVGIQEICEDRNGDGRCKESELVETTDGEDARNKPEKKRVLPYGVSQNVKSILSGVVKFGSGKRAGLGPKVFVAGKTGTTEDYGDAWFVGFTDKYTVAVWVGYPDEVKPMKPPLFSYQGDPVAGGTYPAVIWNTFMKSAIAIDESRAPKDKKGPTGATGPSGPAPAGTAAPAPTGTAQGDGETTKKPKSPKQPQPDEPAPEPTAAQPNPTVTQDPNPSTPPADQGGGAAPPE